LPIYLEGAHIFLLWSIVLLVSPESKEFLEERGSVLKYCSFGEGDFQIGSSILEGFYQGFLSKSETEIYWSTSPFFQDIATNFYA